MLRRFKGIFCHEIACDIYTRFKQFDYISSDTRPSIICLRDTACTFVTSSVWNAVKTWSLRKKYDIPPGNNVL